MGKQWKLWLTLFWGAPKSLQMVIAAIKLKDAIPWKENYDQPRQHIKKPRHYFANKGPSSQGYGFSSGHVWIWELNYKESWVLKNWYFWTVVLEKTLESPLDYKEIQPVYPKGDHSWVFTERTDAGAETPILWPHDAKFSSVQFSCTVVSTLCDPMNCSTPGLPVHHQPLGVHPNLCPSSQW